MATLYCIGGTPRCGKTQLAQYHLRQNPMACVSSDALRHMLWYIIEPSKLPGLFTLQTQEAVPETQLCTYITQHPEEFIDLYYEEARAAWPLIRRYAEHALRRDTDLLIEGFTLLPELLADFPADVRAVYLGNQSPSHAATILKTARSNPSSWMYSLADETIQAYSLCYAMMSRRIEAEASKYGFQYIAMDDDAFSTSLKAASTALAG